MCRFNSKPWNTKAHHRTNGNQHARRFTIRWKATDACSHGARLLGLPTVINGGYDDSTFDNPITAMKHCQQGNLVTQFCIIENKNVQKSAASCFMDASLEFTFWPTGVDFLGRNVLLAFLRFSNDCKWIKPKNYAWLEWFQTIDPDGIVSAEVISYCAVQRNIPTQAEQI